MAVMKCNNQLEVIDAIISYISYVSKQVAN